MNYSKGVDKRMVMIGKTGSKQNRSSCVRFLFPFQNQTTGSVFALMFSASNELNVGIEPQRLTIFGKKEIRAMESEGGKIEYIERYPDQILSLIDLETEILPENSVVELDAGLLKLELPKAAKLKAAAA